MNVPSLAFLGFAGIVALAINLRASPAWRRVVLLLANLAFFVILDRGGRHLAPFVGLLALGFAALKIVEVVKRRTVFVSLLIVELAAFCWLKQYAFVPHALFLREAYLTVGMSYVFFRVLHLLIDGYQDTLPGRVSPLSYVNYTLNFTALVAGPIQLYRDYVATESVVPLPLDGSSLGIGTMRIVTGFFKVVVAAPIFLNFNDSVVADIAAGSPGLSRPCDAAALLAIYPVYLYLNFSGYTDVVIGVARFLRLGLPENFDKPFEARSFIDLWNRWHMTLSTWLKTYVYSPLLLASMRRFPSPSIEPVLGVGAYFVTFFLVGAWHGQTSMFLFFGFLQGLGVSANKAFQIVMIRRLGRKAYRALCANVAFEAASRGITFAYFGFTVLWFWSTWSQLNAFTQQLGFEATLTGPAMTLVAGAVVLTASDRAFRWIGAAVFAPGGAGRSLYVRSAYLATLVALVLSVTVVLAAPAPHIVYRGF